MGFPFGIGPSVSSGVVAGLKREFVDPDRQGSSRKMTNLIQFDAAVNPGNSGGPLVNRDGEVVGIVTAIYNPTGQHVFAGMAFAVPIENAARGGGRKSVIKKGSADTASGAHEGLEHLLYEVKKIVVGQDHFLERVMVALLAGGHLLVEGVPGLAKTLTVSTLARAMRGSFKRIQFTPDLVPADLIGTRIYNQKNSEFATVARPGLRQSGAGRRNQPRPRQGAERAAGSDAGAPGHHRRRVASGAVAFCGDGDAESDRDRRHLCPAGSAGRSLS